MAELFPEAPIYTLFFRKETLSSLFRQRKIYSTFLQFIPGISKCYRWLLPLFPLAVHSLNVRNYDLVISSSHCVAKAVRVRPGAIHLCYCYTPMRYLWEFEEEYFGRFPRIIRWLIKFYFNWLRKWDVENCRSVTSFITISKNTGNKISRRYDRESKVIYPPVEVPERRTPKNGTYFLVVSALVPYKRVDIAIEAFNQLDMPLKIVGNGPLRASLERMARSAKIEFEGSLDQEKLWERYTGARALIFPGEEDFGIVPLEAQMFGKPVLAFGKGGALETVLAHNDMDQIRPVEESSGLFFYEQNPDALIKTVNKFEPLRFNSAFIQSHALQFSRERFQKEIIEYIETYSIRTLVNSRYVTS